MFTIIFKYNYLFCNFDTDSYTRRLEYSIIQWNGKNESLGCSLFRDADDFRQLRVVQFAGSNSG